MRKVLMVTGMLLFASECWAVPGEEAADMARSVGINIPSPAPDRPSGEGEGPFDTLIIENVMLLDGTGSPPRGPVSIVIKELLLPPIQRRRTDG